MAKFARLDENNVVIEVFLEPDGFTVDQCFPPETHALFIPVPDDVTPNSVLNADDSWTIAPIEPFPPPPPEPDPPA
jgi:hypothetical protein